MPLQDEAAMVGSDCPVKRAELDTVEPDPASLLNDKGHILLTQCKASLVPFAQVQLKLR